MQAKQVILMAWGEGKSSIINASVEGPITEQVPASYLQEHPNSVFLLDQGSSSKLTRISTPWIVEKVDWNEKMIKKAVVGLALRLEKPVLMLTEADYIENGMSDLLTEVGDAYDINIRIFNKLQHTITGWPGGKPNADDSNRPERAKPAKKRVLIFSPHPDDDIISMGGTFMRLQNQGHEVHVAYQTSGNIAVADDEALRFSDFVIDYNRSFGLDNKKSVEIYKKATEFIKNKKTSEIDIEEVRNIKGLIRRSEARATSYYVGLTDEQIHFNDLPFYETGTIEKNPPGEKDIKITMDLIEKIKPHQIYAAGDLADPHGTHKVCLDIIFEALKRLKPKSYMKDCWLWLYRGAWQEWDIEDIEMAVPMSPSQVLAKRYGIFKHQSQKDGVVFQGSDSREFWQRAEDRNKETASKYDELGLAHYAAMEAFVRYHF
jgi:glucosamine-6-phosphate deaminase